MLVWLSQQQQKQTVFHIGLNFFHIDSPIMRTFTRSLTQFSHVRSSACVWCNCWCFCFHVFVQRNLIINLLGKMSKASGSNSSLCTQNEFGCTINFAVYCEWSAGSNTQKQTIAETEWMVYTILILSTVKIQCVMYCLGYFISLFGFFSHSRSVVRCYALELPMFRMVKECSTRSQCDVQFYRLVVVLVVFFLDHIAVWSFSQNANCWNASRG